jgi:uncharacterized metal-binding protein YceD (DUF177 family)
MLPLPSFKPPVMANKRTFEIAFVGLKPGIHEFNYEVDDKFFVDKGATDFTNCHAKVKLQLDKKVGFMLLKFEIGGSADVSCDRCGNSLPIDIWDEFNMLVKMVENPDEMNEQEEDPDVFYISRTESHIDVANWIYEFVLLSFPIQKMCPDNEKGESTCNKEVLEKLKEMEAKSSETANVLWKALEQFKETSKKNKSNKN